MSDQANAAMRNQYQGLGLIQGGGYKDTVRASKVWIAYRDYGHEGKSEPLAVFGSKALADIFVAGAEAAHGTVLVAEMSINYGS